ncbi:hypothetical protein EVAR_43967_1 [Eumeta japonica]|uniref:Ig-like domain-containing protein n=1 Tax=Eumeta variegata TaxID=151549 RepID=A0A4C1XYF2_EUMVA|nr:hypothetical protein EVAR_43967_1 [Eumeta japonica]
MATPRARDSREPAGRKPQASGGITHNSEAVLAGATRGRRWARGPRRARQPSCSRSTSHILVFKRNTQFLANVYWELNFPSGRIRRLDSAEEVLTINSATTEDNGVYTCRIEGYPELHKACVFKATLNLIQNLV